MLDKFLQDANDYAFIEQEGQVLISKGESREFETLKELEEFQQETKKKVIFLLPFCLASREKGYETHGNEPILAMQVEEELQLSKEELLSCLPDNNLEHSEIIPSISNEDFGGLVNEIKQEIFDGNICQGVISRDFVTEIEPTQENILSIYRKLLGIKGGYMTFLFNNGNKVFTGASPEVHLRIDEQSVVKAPIAGTIPKKKENFYQNLIEFLQNSKEENELSMVIDEELKMIMKVAKTGKISGPKLREIGQVVHTEAELIGERDNNLSHMDILRETLFSPTLVGGPIESAFEQIKKYEERSRRYYGGAFGIFDEKEFDSSIVIRASEIDRNSGKLKVSAGAGIVEDSVPELEVLETENKAKGFLGVLGKSSAVFENYLDKLTKKELVEINNLLDNRQKKLSSIYFEEITEKLEVPEIKGKSFTLINNGDDFVFMLGYLIGKMGGKVEIINNLDIEPDQKFGNDFVLLGPGPGNINDESDEKMRNLLLVTDSLQRQNKKTIGICLGHQAICKNKNLKVEKQEKVTQGEQAEVEIFGETEKVAFYNSFSPILGKDNDFEEVEVENERLIYLKDKNNISVQFHPESIMSVSGFEILKNMILKIN